MQAVENDEDYILRWPCDSVFSALTSFDDKNYNELYNLQQGKNTIYYKKIKAKEYYDAIVKNAHASAEPGQFFWDRIINYDPSSAYEEYYIDGTNACGEQPMSVGDTCRLICLNLLSFVDSPFTNGANINAKKLYEVAYEQARLGDDLVDLEIEYIDRIIEKIHSDDLPDNQKQTELDLWYMVRQIANNGRRVGCGITALGDMLAALGVSYDSDEALEYTKLVMKIKMQAELDCMIDLAILRGTFVGCDTNKEFGVNMSQPFNDWYAMLTTEFPNQAARMYQFGRRSVNFSTIAPTGSVSILTQTSSGCEPLFMPYYIRRKKINPADKSSRVDMVDQNGDKWQEYPVLHPQFQKWIDMVGMELFDNQEELKLLGLTKADYQFLFENSPWYQSTANDIDWVRRVEMQSVLQKYTTSAISSTVNLPSTVTTDDVAEIYMEAWKKGLKGITIYVEGCRTGVLVSDNTPKTSFEYHDAPKRPKSLPVKIHSVTSRGIKFNVIVGMFDDKPYEVFAVPHFTKETDVILTKYAKGRYDLELNGETYSENITSEMTPEEENLTRLISTALRHGASITYVTEQLNKSKGDITSFAKAIARVLSLYSDSSRLIKGITCNECGSSDIILEEGCQKCKNCGNSKCS